MLLLLLLLLLLLPSFAARINAAPVFLGWECRRDAAIVVKVQLGVCSAEGIVWIIVRRTEH